MTEFTVTFEGKEVPSAHFHIEKKSLWVKLTLKEKGEGTRVFDVELQKSDKMQVVDLGGLAPKKGLKET